MNPVAPRSDSPEGGRNPPYFVFSQEPKGPPDHVKLAANAARFFASTLDALEQGESSVVVRLQSPRYGVEGEFIIQVRDTTQADRGHARDAETRGRAGGMGALAEKCGSVWQLAATGTGPTSEAAYLTLCAICASVALGPVMPADHSTLFGVRGAIERRDRALES
jgi:hypothetical protein